MNNAPSATVSDLKLHHAVTGPTVEGEAGETLVFLHALGCDLQLWETVAVRFAVRHRVVRYDLRGHGRSECGPGECTIEDHVGDLMGLLDGLGVARATLVGISVGGMIALATAWRRPERVRRMVLCATAARIGTRESWTERIEAVRVRGLEGMADAILARWVRPEFAAREVAVMRELKGTLTRTPVGGYLATCAALRDADLTRQAGRLRVPALVLNGDHDVAVPAAAGRKLANLLPEARWVSVSDAGHLPPLEQPEATTAAIAGFLGETA